MDHLFVLFVFHLQRPKKHTKDVKYKTKEAAGLDKNVAELSTDLSGVTDELSAVLSGLDKLTEMCRHTESLKVQILSCEQTQSEST